MTFPLYADEDASSLALLHGLRARGVDIVSAYDAGLAGADDRAQLVYAPTQERVLYTFNAGHFYQLHADWLAHARSHAGIIVVHRQKYPVGEQIRRLLRIISTRSTHDMRNTLHFL